MKRLELNGFSCTEPGDELAVIDGAKTKCGLLDLVSLAVGFDLFEKGANFNHAPILVGFCPFVNGLLPKCYGLPILKCCAHGK